MSPTARLAVVRFDGRDLLLGMTGQSIALLARTDPAAPAQAPTPTQEEAP
jgi:flagellar biogenesis protein FliO